MKRKVAKILGLSIAIILISQHLQVFAVTAEQKKLQQEQSQIDDQIEDAKKKKEEIEAQKSEAMKSVEELMDKISVAEDEVDELQSQVDDLESQISEKEKNIESKEEEYTEQQKLLDSRLIAIYERNQTSYLEVLLTASSMTEFLAKYNAASELIECDKELIQSIKDQKAQIENEKIELETAKANLDKSLTEKEAKSEELKSLKKEKDAKVAELTQEEKEAQQEIEELQAHEKTISQKIAQMQKEYDEQQKKNNSSSGSSGSGSSGSNTNTGTNPSTGFGWPVKDNTIGTKYGVSGPYWSSGYHTGVDFPVPTGTQVYSVGDGQVFDTGYSSAYGNFVEIYHGNNIYSFYAHASKVQVSVGQKVSKGDPIMLSGKSGNVTGPHLHFEIRTPGYKYSNCVNPMNYLP